MKQGIYCSEMSGDGESELSLSKPLLIPSETTQRKLKKL